MQKYVRLVWCEYILISIVVRCNIDVDFLRMKSAECVYKEHNADKGAAAE